MPVSVSPATGGERPESHCIAAAQVCAAKDSRGSDVARRCRQLSALCDGYQSVAGTRLNSLRCKPGVTTSDPAAADARLGITPMSRRVLLEDSRTAQLQPPASGRPLNP